MRTRILILITAAFFLPACAMPPGKAPLEGVPIVTYGENVPRDSDYILFFPAGKLIPTEVAISGNIFSAGAKGKLAVSLQQDIYAYHEWVSFDGQEWQRGKDIITAAVDIKIPGYTHPEPGRIHVSLNKVKQP